MLSVHRSMLATRIAGLALAVALLGVPMGAFAEDAGATPDATSSTPAPAAEQHAPLAPPKLDPDAVVATVGDQKITEADLGFAAQDLAQELQQVPQEQQRAFLTTVLIDMKVMAQAARADKLDQQDLYKQRMQYLTDRTLRQAYFQEKAKAALTPDALKQAYADYTKAFQPQEEVHAEHILVKTEDEAKAVKKQLDGGANFEDLAKAKSTDKGSGANGGDLGYFTKAQMVKPFADAAFAMKVGEISDPVQTQFGWHIIKLIDKKKTEPETYDKMVPQLRQQVIYKTFDETVAALKKNAKIDIPDEILAKQIKAQDDKDTSQ